MACSIAISAGEASGDLNGAHLVGRLKSIRDDLRIWGAGGSRLREAGVEIAVDMSGLGTIGISQTLLMLPSVAARYLRLRSELLRRRPDLFVPIDFGAFNVRLGQVAHKNGIPVVYYFPPSSWRRRPTNFPKLLACGGKVITPFDWSAEWLTSQGVDARFVGHPLIDIVKPTVDKAGFLREFDLSEGLPVIGMLPGSRGHEISEHLSRMVDAAEIMHRELGGAQFVIAASGIRKRANEYIKSASANKPDFPAIRVVENRTYDCLAHSDMLICKSGTATLEAAILGTPMIIVYRGTGIMRLEYRLRKSVLEEYIGMPNLVVGRGVCPEMLNWDVTAEKMADIALSILRDESALAKMRAGLAEVKQRLGEPGAVDRAAHVLLEMGGLT